MQGRGDHSVGLGWGTVVILALAVCLNFSFYLGFGFWEKAIKHLKNFFMVRKKWTVSCSESRVMYCPLCKCVNPIYIGYWVWADDKQAREECDGKWLSLYPTSETPARLSEAITRIVSHSVKRPSWSEASHWWLSCTQSGKSFALSIRGSTTGIVIPSVKRLDALWIKEITIGLIALYHKILSNIEGMPVLQ